MGSSPRLLHSSGSRLHLIVAGKSTAIMDEGTPSGSKLPTPPPRAPENLELTHEQVKRIELNRLKGGRDPARSSSSQHGLLTWNI